MKCNELLLGRTSGQVFEFSGRYLCPRNSPAPSSLGCSGTRVDAQYKVPWTNDGQVVNELHWVDAAALHGSAVAAQWIERAIALSAWGDDDDDGSAAAASSGEATAASSEAAAAAAAPSSGGGAADVANAASAAARSPARWGPRFTAFSHNKVQLFVVDLAPFIKVGPSKGRAARAVARAVAGGRGRFRPTRSA